MSTEDDLRRDPHLEAALRHAPDADVAVPPLLRARIVAAAHRSAEDARRPASWLARLDGWLTPMRLGGAGTAMAAVLAATVLWVGRDEQPSAPTTVANQSLPPTAAVTSATGAHKETAAAARPTATAASPQPSATATESPARQRLDESANRARATAAPAATRPAPATPPPLAGAVADAAPPSASPQGQGDSRAHPPSPFPAREEDRKRETLPPPRPEGAAPAATTPAEAPSPAARMAETARLGRAPGAGGADRRAAADAANAGPAASPVAPTRFFEAWFASTSGWRRRMASGEEVPVDPAWLAELARTAAGRWAPVAPPSRDAPDTARDTWLLTGPDGRRARFDWSVEALVVCDLTTNRCEQALLGEAALGALRRSFR